MTRRQARAEAIQRLAVRRLRTFMANHGYPDPDTMRSERTIWHGTNGQIHNNRVCSTSSAGTVVVTSPEIVQIVTQAYQQHLALPSEWSPAQRQAFIQAEADKISYRVAELAAELEAQAVGEWTRSRGQPPDYLTKVGLVNTARSQAMEIVLSEDLYEQIPNEEDPPSSLWGEDQPTARAQSAALGSAVDEPGVSQRPQPGHRGPDRAVVAETSVLGGVSDQSRVSTVGPGRGRPSGAERPSGPADRRAGADDLFRSAQRRPARTVTKQPSLFDEVDQPTDPRTIDPGGAPLPPPTPPAPAPEQPAATAAASRPRAPDLPLSVAEPSSVADDFATPTDFPASRDTLVPSGAKARVRANIAALQMLDTLRDARRPATLAEQRVLAAWSGWGAVPQVFDTRNTDFAEDRATLHAMLGRDEYRQAEASILNAHYTDPAIAAAVWDALGRAGFTGGRVLEPGCGSGTFISHAPDEAVMVGVEADATTAAIAALLYPSAQIRHEGFETTRVPENSFTAAIGNVPFGRYAVTDPPHNPARHSIHNHFIIKVARPHRARRLRRRADQPLHHGLGQTVRPPRHRRHSRPHRRDPIALQSVCPRRRHRSRHRPTRAAPPRPPDPGPRRTARLDRHRTRRSRRPRHRRRRRDHHQLLLRRQPPQRARHTCSSATACTAPSNC